MQQKTLLTTLFTFAVSTFASAQQFSSPGEYSDYIVKESSLFSEKMLEYTLVSTHSDKGSETANALRNATRQLLAGLSKIERLEPYKGDGRFRNEALSVFKQHKANMEADFDLLITLKEGSKNSYEAMEKYFKANERAQKKLHQTYEKFELAQREFAKKYNMTINKREDAGDFTEMVRIVSEVQDYTQKVYLACFRVDKAESAFMAQLNEKKENNTLLERRRAELLAAAKLASAQIGTIPKKYPDDRYRDAVKKKIDFYTVKAEKDLSEIVRIQAAGTKKTSADVAIYNKTMVELNTFSQTITKELNDTNQEVSRNHVPKPKGATRKM